MTTQDTWKDEGLAWGSHLPALMACVAASEGPVLELGSGNYSTPCLRAVCQVLGREFVTVEQDDAWREQFMCYASPNHQVLKLEPGLPEKLAERKWGVVFVDDFPDYRHSRLDIFFNSAQFMVYHDYNFDDMKPKFDAWLAKNTCYYYIYTRYGPNTLVISKDQPIPAFCP